MKQNWRQRFSREAWWNWPLWSPIMLFIVSVKLRPISIRMAKDQDLSLNPDKISGICGRLMCCLAYEYDTYAEIEKKITRE